MYDECDAFDLTRMVSTSSRSKTDRKSNSVVRIATGLTNSCNAVREHDFRRAPWMSHEQRMTEHDYEQHRDAGIKSSIELALFAQQHDRQQHRIHGLHVDSQRAAEGTQVSQRYQRQGKGQQRATNGKREQIERVTK